MSRVRKGREIDAALCKKGFRRDISGDHICYFFMDDRGEDSDIKTKVSHGVMGDTIGANLISRMSRQLRLMKTQFLDLIDCSLNEDGYRKVLRAESQKRAPNVREGV